MQWDGVRGSVIGKALKEGGGRLIHWDLKHKRSWCRHKRYIELRGEDRKFQFVKITALAHDRVRRRGRNREREKKI